MIQNLPFKEPLKKEINDKISSNLYSNLENEQLMERQTQEFMKYFSETLVNNLSPEEVLQAISQF
jgi:hypothetical protein